MAVESLVSLLSLLRNDIMRFSVLGFRSDIRIELQAPVISLKPDARGLESCCGIH